MTDRTDNFNRSNGAIGTPSDAGSDWVELTGTAWEVNGNAARNDAAVLSNGICYLESSVTAVTVQATFTVLPNTPNAEPGLSIRVVDASNCWFFKIRQGTTTVELRKRVAASNTTVGSTTVTHTAGDVYAVDVNSSDQWDVKQNAASIITATDSAVNTGTKHGLWMHLGSGADGVRWDDFSITAIGGATDPEGSLIGGKLLRGGLLLHGVLGR
jgi:hypothetical protein